MNLSPQQKSGRLLLVIVLAMATWHRVSSSDAADGSDDIAANVIFEDDFIVENLATVCRRAKLLEPNSQFEVLRSWVLPSATHKSFRLNAMFTEANRPRRELLEGTNERPDSDATVPDFRVPTSKLICPALDLVEVAGRLGELAELRDQVATVSYSPGIRNDQSAAALLFLIELERGDKEAAQEAAERLMELTEDFQEFDESNSWPLIVAAWASLKNNDRASRIADLLTSLHTSQLNLASPRRGSAWVEQVAALHVFLQTTRSPTLANWISADIATAVSSAQGWPGIFARQHQQGLQFVASHKQSLLFYRLPLRGDFDFSCEIPAQTIGDVSIMYAGLYATPVGDPLQNRTGNIRESHLDLFDPPITPPGEWVWCRIRVRDNECTTSFNGRILQQRVLPANHAPWLAIRTTSSRTQPIVRNIRIDGDPDIPHEVDLCDGRDLNAWWPYFGDDLGTNGTWRPLTDDDGQGLSALNQPAYSAAFKESLLQYSRPLTAGDSVEYDFYCDAESAQIYPAFGCIAILLRPDGVSLHAVTNGKQDQAESDPASVLTSHHHGRDVALPSFRRGQWNQCRLSLGHDAIEVFVNDEMVCSCPWRSTTPGHFGFFRYADAADVKIRNVIWRNRQLPERIQEIEHQVVSHAPHPLDKRLADLEVFDYDFSTSRMLRESFTLPSGDATTLTLAAGGVKHSQSSTGTWTDSSLEPVFDLHGDFDVTVTFDNLQISEPEYGGCGVIIRTDDGHVVLLSRRRRQGNLHRVYLTWRVPAGDGEFRFNKDVLITEAPAGRLRVARRGDTYSFLVAENDSPVYRDVVEQTVKGGGKQVVRIELRMIASLRSTASVVWKHVRIASEKLSRFRYHATRGAISDSQWAIIAKATGLTELILDSTTVTDDDLARLKEHHNIRLLYLKATGITSSGLQELSHMKGLEHLHLTQSRIDDEAATTLGRLTKLKTLGLSHTMVTDVTISKLSTLPKLRVLGLKNTGVTDAAIDSFSKMTALRTVNLQGTQLSNAGFDRFLQTLPECKVTR